MVVTPSVIDKSCGESPSDIVTSMLPVSPLHVGCVSVRDIDTVVTVLIVTFVTTVSQYPAAPPLSLI